MSKNIIIITNLANVGNKAIEVENFSDANVKEAIKTLSGVSGEDLQCENTGGTGAAYSIRKNIKKNKGIFIHTFTTPKIREDNHTFDVVEVKYATLV